MDVPTKTFEADALQTGVIQTIEAPRISIAALESPAVYRKYFIWLQLIVAYVFMERALWSSSLAFRNRWAMVAIVTVFAFALVDRPSVRRMGLALPDTLGASIVLAVSFAVAVFLIVGVRLVGGQIPANPTWPSLHLTWEYIAWALIQEFILQSFFFTRCEELFGSSPAVWVAATLFAAAHLPSPILTTFTLVGGLFFCEMFRRYRSIYPIGAVHAVLGLTLALTMPGSLLHDMRVGIGYLRY
jgi:membrane protease YdiL (CAAX protease family)